jgi:hypothetical protein
MHMNVPLPGAYRIIACADFTRLKINVGDDSKSAPQSMTRSTSAA